MIIMWFEKEHYVLTSGTKGELKPENVKHGLQEPST